MTKLSRNHVTTYLLVIILLMAAALRFYNLSWDNGIFAHPDERSTVAFYAPTIRWPENPDDLLDPRASPLNPFWDVNNDSRRSYTYGHFPLYLLVLTANAFHALAPTVEGLFPAAMVEFLAASRSGQGFALIGRALVALADLASVYLIYLLGRRIYGVWGGLLAAALSAVTVLQIQLAHFFAVDPISTTFTLLALYGALLMYDRRTLGTALLTGLGIGLAVASKFSALPVLFAPVAASIMAIYHVQYRPIEKDEPSPPNIVARMLNLTIAAFVVAFLTFAVTSPFVLLDFENFQRAVIEEQGNMVSGVADFPFTRQYRGTTSYWYFIEQQLQWGMGWPLGLLALAGTLWVLIKAIRFKAHPGELLALGWVILYFGPTGLFLAKFMRYMVPIVPLLTLFGAGLIIAIARLGQRKPVDRVDSLPDETVETNETDKTETAPSDGAAESTEAATEGTPINQKPTFLSRLSQGVAVMLAAVVVGSSMVWAMAFVNGVYGTEHSWVTFSRWIYENVPAGSCMAVEHWDDRLPTSLPEPNGNPGAHGYQQPQLPMYEEDTQAKYENLRATLMECDYIVLATNRLWRTIPKLPERYPMSTRYYEALFSGELGFELAHTVETPPRLGSLVIDTQPADESFTVYDHPQPMIFEKTRQLSMAEWDALLGETWQTARRGYVGEPTLMMILRGGGNLPPAQSAEAEGERKSLLLEQPIAELPVVGDYRWNSLANNATPVAVITWWLAVMVLGLLAWPLTFQIFNKLPDHGYAFSKSLGLLLVSYFVWLNSSLEMLQNRLSTILVGVILLLGLAVWLFRRHRQAMLDFAREYRWLIITTELLFAAVYLFFIYLRIRNPDLWQPWLGGEKMMEIGFLNAVLKSALMPPYDPFFAGGIMNYYYYGLFIVNILIKLTGIQPTIAFNLAVAMLAGLTAINVFSLTRSLAVVHFPPLHRERSWPPMRHLGETVLVGLLGVLFVLFIGNLEGAAQLMRELARYGSPEFESAVPGVQTLMQATDGLYKVINGEQPLTTYNYWDPTRVIPATINEFPYFSFLFADLHPHMMNLPFTVLFLGLAYNWLRPMKPVSKDSVLLIVEDALLPSVGYHLLRWLILPFVLGALAVINTWDLPTYLGLMVATFLLTRYRRLSYEELRARRIIILLIMGLVFGGLLLGAAYLMYLPFFIHYQALDVGLGLVHTQTALDAHLRIWGFFLFIIVTWLLISLRHPTTRHNLLRGISIKLRHWHVWPHMHELQQRIITRKSTLYQLGMQSISLIVVLAIVLALLGYRVPAYLLPLVFLATLLLFRRRIRPEVCHVGLLIFTGLLLLLGVEFLFLRDFLGGGDYYRMNTLFKFYTQVWVLLGIGSAVAFIHMWQWSSTWSLGRLFAWRSMLILLLLATLVYPVFATPTRMNDRFPGERPPIGTLDGLAYMTVGQFEWPAGRPIILRYDYEAIQWLQENVPGTPIIAEAKVGYYREGGMRVAAYTGLPSILGGLHQGEQRYAEQVGQRDQRVREFWATADPNRAQALMEELDIAYVYVGQIERITHGDAVGQKFMQLAELGVLEVVFENEETTIYKRTSSDGSAG